MSWVALAKVWAVRDARYAQNAKRAPLTAAQEEAIRYHRRLEADLLTGVDRLRALSAANAWRAPWFEVRD